MIEYTVRVHDNRTEWLLNGKQHRTDGPAIEYANGTKSWWLNDQFHREDGPAFDGFNGYKKWFLNGKLHRENGPAIEWANGNKSWYLNDKQYTEEEFIAKTKPVKELTVAEIEKLLGYQVKVVK